MRAAAHLAGVGSIYPSPAYGSQASAIQLRQRPGDVAGPVREGTPIGSPDTVIRAGGGFAEGRATTHWAENTGKLPAVWIAVDIPKP